MSFDEPAIDGEETQSNLSLDRFVFSQGLDLILNSSAQLASVFGGDLVRALVFFAIVRASVAHLNVRGALSDQAQDGLFPNDLRRPVSVLGVSQFLSVPYETTRRHVLRLVEDGLCRRLGSRQFIVESDVLERPDIVELATYMSRQLQLMSRRVEAACRTDGEA